jgi:hypothetical protein
MVDAGWYQCTAISPAGKAITKCKVTVIRMYSIYIPIRDKHRTERAVVLSCRSEGQDRWHKLILCFYMDSFLQLVYRTLD